MSKRTIAVGAILILFSVITSLAFFTVAYSAIQSINPVAAVAAITVVVVGIVWFKKTSG